MPLSHPTSVPTFDAAMSLVNSKVPEQRERGLMLLERGEFLQPDSAKVCIAVSRAHAFRCAPSGPQMMLAFRLPCLCVRSLWLLTTMPSSA